MEIGTEVSLDAPYGSFTLHNNLRIPAVFLTGASELHLSEASSCKLLMTIFLIRSLFSIPTGGRKTLLFWAN
jgi:hypothetical protein